MFCNQENFFKIVNAVNHLLLYLFSHLNYHRERSERQLLLKANKKGDHPK